MEQTFFVVTYRDPEKLGHTITVKVKEVRDSELGLSFVSLRGFLFADQGLIIAPEEEKLRQKFEHTKSLHLSIHTIVSVEEVGANHPGLTFQKDKANLLVLTPQQTE